MFIPDESVTKGQVLPAVLTSTRCFAYQLQRGKRAAVVSCVCEAPNPRPFVMTLKFHLPCFLTESVWDRHELCRGDVLQCLMAYVSWHLWSLILIENGHIANPALKSSRATDDAFIPGGKVLALKRICGFIDKAKPSSDGDAHAVACGKCGFEPGLKQRPETASVMNRPGDTHIPKLPSHRVGFQIFASLSSAQVVRAPDSETLRAPEVFCWRGISFVALQQEAHDGVVYLLCSRVVEFTEYQSALRTQQQHRMMPILVVYGLLTLAIMEESFWLHASDGVERDSIPLTGGSPSGSPSRSPFSELKDEFEFESSLNTSPLLNSSLCSHDSPNEHIDERCERGSSHILGESTASTDSPNSPATPETRDEQNLNHSPFSSSSSEFSPLIEHTQREHSTESLDSLQTALNLVRIAGEERNDEERGKDEGHSLILAQEISNWQNLTVDTSCLTPPIYAQALSPEEQTPNSASPVTSLSSSLNSSLSSNLSAASSPLEVGALKSAWAMMRPDTLTNKRSKRKLTKQSERESTKTRQTLSAT